MLAKVWTAFVLSTLQHSTPPIQRSSNRQLMERLTSAPLLMGTSLDNLPLWNLHQVSIFPPNLQQPVLMRITGNYWKGIESLIISHTSDESELFVDGHIQTDEEFSEFIHDIFPEYAETSGINAAIESFYPPVSTNDTYDSVTDRTKGFVRDTCFTCPARFLTEAYAGSTWNMEYAVTPGWHATDLLPTFYSSYVSFGGDVPITLIPGFGNLAQGYQSYLTSHARSGDPNTYRSDSSLLGLFATVEWTRPTDITAEDLGNVLKVEDLGFSLGSDDQFPYSHCDFIRQLCAAVTNVGGYAVPGTEQEQSLVAFTGDASANYTGLGA